MTDAVYEMFWDCRYCGQKKLLGLTHRFCAGCGAPQDPGTRYFPAEHEKVAVHQHVYVGADVRCPACRQPMSRAARCCTHCGSPLDRGAQVGLVGGPVEPPRPAPRAHAPPAHAPPKKKSNVGLVVGVVAAVLGGILLFAFGLVLVAAFWTRDGSFEVSGHTWERSIALERYENVRKDVWCDSVPAGGRELSRSKEERSTRRIPDGEDCETKRKDNGDGTYRQTRECTPRYKEESVMDWRCRIEIAEWRPSRTLVEKGTSPDDPPRWPAPPPRAGVCVGCEREGKRTEKYTVEFFDSAAKTGGSCTLPEERWRGFTKGARYKGKIGVMTGLVECDALTPH